MLPCVPVSLCGVVWGCEHVLGVPPAAPTICLTAPAALALQGVPRRSKKLPVAPDSKLPQPDPTLVCCAYRKQRLYLFTQREPQEAEDAANAR